MVRLRAANLCVAIALLLAGCANPPGSSAAIPTDEAAIAATPIPGEATYGPSESNSTTSRPVIVPSPTPKPLEGKKIGIDPGHQSKANMTTEPIAPGSGVKNTKVTGGTQGIATGISEQQFNLELALILQDLLMEYGAEVYMTRTTADVNISNAERAQLVSQNGCSAWIRIHADGSDDRSVSGMSMLVPNSKYLSEELCDESSLLGECIIEGVIEKTGARSRGLIERSNIAGFNWSEIPVCLIECGFMSNAREDRLLAQKDYKMKIAEGIAEGFVKYYNSLE